MRPAAFREFAWRFAVQEGAEPLLWRSAVHWQASHRLFSVMRHNYAVIGADYDVLPVFPLVAPGFVAALARSAGVLGFSDRAQAMTWVAGDLLPAAVLNRTSKAGFSRAYFTRVSRSFAESWDGTGVDPELVDPEALKRSWLKPLVPAPSYALLQAVWMAQHAVPMAGAEASGPGARGRREQTVGN
jgi:asparagine synthase (glutamine-hydrolysing)